MPPKERCHRHFQLGSILNSGASEESSGDEKLPTPLFLHGNVAHGYCDRDRFQGSRRAPCLRCGEPPRDDRLLFPVAKKDYSSDASINKAWEVMREALKNSLVVTVFGYSAPASDKDALSLMSDAWGTWT
jgi:hypothetical protein